jgi:hypothetical protein
MDPTQLKASYDQAEFLANQIYKLDSDLLSSQNQQTTALLNSQERILSAQERSGYATEGRANRNQQQVIDNINRNSDTILNSQAVLIKHKNFTIEQQQILNRLLFRIESVKKAKKNKYVLLRY